MGVPKKRKSKMKTALRRSHHALESVNLVACSHCGAPSLPHRACSACGHYHGKPAVAIK